MKFQLLLSIVWFAPLSLLSQTSQTSEPAPASFVKDHSDYLFNSELWETPIEQFQKQYKNINFRWQTNKKDALRSTAKIPLFGQKSGETLVSSRNGNLSMLTFSIFSRGDHGKISVAELDRKFNAIAKKLAEHLGKKPKNNSRKGAVMLTAYQWRDEVTAYQLEKSSNRGQGELLRLRIAPYKDVQRGDGNQTASRSSLRSNLVRSENGDVFIDNIPMVDQGRKGYCACASSARIFQYYGRNLSMHEVAQMAGSTASRGTSMRSMVSAFKKAAGKLNSRVVILYEYPKYMSKSLEDLKQSQIKSAYRESASDINKYQALAKKKKGRMLTINGKLGGKVPTGMMLNIMAAKTQMDGEIYKEFMVKKSNYSRFKSQLKKYINEGIPVGWCLQLGMFKEPAIPQVGGGHMRLIIGYNDTKDEIIYSDSWGKGHEKKSMPMANAYCMTNVLLAMPPSR